MRAAGLPGGQWRGSANRTVFETRGEERWARGSLTVLSLQHSGQDHERPHHGVFFVLENVAVPGVFVPVLQPVSRRSGDMERELGQSELHHHACDLAWVHAQRFLPAAVVGIGRGPGRCWVSMRRMQRGRPPGHSPRGSAWSGCRQLSCRYPRWPSGYCCRPRSGTNSRRLATSDPGTQSEACRPR